MFFVSVLVYLHMSAYSCECKPEDNFLWKPEDSSRCHFLRATHLVFWERDSHLSDLELTK